MATSERMGDGGPAKWPESKLPAIIADARLDNVLATELLNQRLGPHTGECAAAFRAALFMGAAQHQAWEAARRHAVMRAYQALESVRNTEPPRSDVRHWTGWDDKHRRSLEHRESHLAELLALDNPFTNDEPEQAAA